VNEANDAAPTDVANISLPAGTNASEPYGIATNGSSTLIVSDANNARALVYTLSSTSPYVTLDYQVDLPAAAIPDGVADVSVPTPALSGANVNLAFIGDEYGNQVTVIDPPLAGANAAAGNGSGSGSATAVPTLGTTTGTPAGTGVTPAAAAASGSPLAPVTHAGTKKKAVKKHKKAKKHHKKKKRAQKTALSGHHEHKRNR
jgi:hypothetical protein